MKMRNRMFLLLVTLLTSLSITQDALAGDRCYSENLLVRRFRRIEALNKVQELNASITDALDNVLATNGSGPIFDANIQYVIDLQVDPEHMDITINNSHVTDAASFRLLWQGLAQAIKYRKRFLTNYIVEDYQDKHCLRTIQVHIVGTSFVTFPNDNNSAIFDRLVTVWEEVCRGQFRVKSITQINESQFSLPPGNPVLPFIPGAVFVPKPVKQCDDDLEDSLK